MSTTHEQNNGQLPASERITDEAFTDVAVVEEPAKKGKKKGPSISNLEQRVVELEAKMAALLDGQQAMMDTVAELGKTGHTGAKTGSTAPRLGKGIFGISATSILRWMGKHGWSNKECYVVISGYGIDISPATIQTQRQCGRKDVGTLPTLTEEQVKELDAKRAAVTAKAETKDSDEAAPESKE